MPPIDSTPTNPVHPAPMLRERELAARWQLSRRTLQRWRAAGTGPAYHVIGGTIRYRLDQVLAFEQLNQRRGANT